MSEQRMNDKPDGKQWGWSTWAWVVVVLLTLYVLSVGPVYAIAEPNSTMTWASPILYVIYRPHAWVCNAIGWPAWECLRTYERFWRDARDFALCRK